MKKLTAIILIIATLTTMLSLFAFPASAAKSTTYDADAALRYAAAHWNDGKGLCAEFVSDCLRAGGFTAVYNKNAKELGRALQKYGDTISCTGWSSRACLKASNFSSPLSKGDIIVWENKSGKWSGHVAIYSGQTNSKGQILVYAHNSAKNKDVLQPASAAATVYAIHLNGSTQSPVSNDEVPTNVYVNLVNKKSGKYLNVAYSSSRSGANVDIFQKDYTSGEEWMIVPHGTNKYVIIPQCAPKCALNCYTSGTPRANTNLTTWSRSNHITQDFLFEKVSGGWIIRSAANPSLVVTATSTRNSGNVCLKAYSGSTYQIWNFS